MDNVPLFLGARNDWWWIKLWAWHALTCGEQVMSFLSRCCGSKWARFSFRVHPLLSLHQVLLPRLWSVEWFGRCIWWICMDGRYLKICSCSSRIYHFTLALWGGIWWCLHVMIQVTSPPASLAESDTIPVSRLFWSNNIFTCGSSINWDYEVLL